MATAGASLLLSAAAATTAESKPSESPKMDGTLKLSILNSPWKSPADFSQGRVSVRPITAVPENLTDKVADSVKNAEEACAGDPASGECVAAWDEVEELSAAASHARDKNKGADPLENYCKDNPETDECRTYDN